MIGITSSQLRDVQHVDKSDSVSAVFSIYFISNHLFSLHSHEVIPYLIFMKFSALNAEINIVSSSYNLQIILFLLSLKN